MMSPEDQRTLTRPVKRIVELAFDSILKNGDQFIFLLDGKETVRVNRSTFSLRQQSLFDSLSEFKIGS